MDEAEPKGRHSPARGAAAQDRHKLLVPLVVACAMLMESLDQTIVTTSLPQIAASLGESPLRLNLAITAYLLSLGVFIPVSGWIADRFGARTVFCGAVALFTVSSALCGAAQSLPVLVAMRTLQGAGGALMSPVGRLVLLKSFPRSEIVRAMGYVMMPALIGPALGPLVGGFLTTYASWRWIFYINVPVGILGMALGARYFDNFRGEARVRFDMVGFVLCGVGLAATELALEYVGRHVVPNGWIAAAAAVAALSLGIYGFHARRTHDPVVDLALFRIKTFRIGTVGGTLSRIGFGSTTFLLPLLLQLPLGFSAFRSGLFTSLMAVGAMLMRTVTPCVLARFGFRSVLVANGATVAVLMLGLALIGKATPGWALAGFLLILGFFRSLQFSALSNLAYADLAGGQISSGSSLSSVMQQVSASFGVAIAASLLALLAGPGRVPDAGQFAAVFSVMTVFCFVSLLWFVQPAPSDATLMSGHRAAAKADQGPCS